MRKIARKLYRAIPFKQSVFGVVRRLVRVPEPIFRHLHFEGVIDVPVRGTSFRMRHHGTQIENEVFWSGLFGRWEGGSLRAWVAAARSAGGILDVGANAGLYALAAAAVAPRAAVAALEPVARIRAKLEENVALNGFGTRVRVIDAAASDRDGEGALLDTGEAHELSATLDPAGAVLAGKLAHSVRVPVARVDTLVASGRIPPPDLVKIDVEGHEAAVLRGMRDQLRTRRPILFVELLAAAAAAEVDGLLRPLGYVAHRLDPDGPQRLDAAQPTPGTNVLLCTESAFAKLAPALNETAPAA